MLGCYDLLKAKMLKTGWNEDEAHQYIVSRILHGIDIDFWSSARTCVRNSSEPSPTVWAEPCIGVFATIRAERHGIKWDHCPIISIGERKSGRGVGSPGQSGRLSPCARPFRYVDRFVSVSGSTYPFSISFPFPLPLQFHLPSFHDGTLKDCLVPHRLIRGDRLRSEKLRHYVDHSLGII